MQKLFSKYTATFPSISSYGSPVVLKLKPALYEIIDVVSVLIL